MHASCAQTPALGLLVGWSDRDDTEPRAGLSRRPDPGGAGYSRTRLKTVLPLQAAGGSAAVTLSPRLRATTVSPLPMAVCRSAGVAGAIGYALVGAAPAGPSRSRPPGIVPALGRTPVTLARAAPTPASFTLKRMAPYHVAEPLASSATQLTPGAGGDTQRASTSPRGICRLPAGRPKNSTSARRGGRAPGPPRGPPPPPPPPRPGAPPRARGRAPRHPR